MKFYLLNVVKISLILLAFFYLTIKLTFGSKSIFKYYKLNEKFKSNKASLEFLTKENLVLSTKLSLLNEKSVNVLYLEEVARTKLQFGKNNEKLIILTDEA